ncbi:MAG: cupin domain-containing protein [Gemmatimonadales bacterium]
MRFSRSGVQTALAVAFVSVCLPLAASAQDGVGVWRQDELARRDGALATTIGADGSSRETLADYGDHRFRFLRRASDGRPEQHDQIVDVVIVHSGRGTLLVGGRMVNPTGNAATGEYLGTAIEGGRRYDLGPGDVVHIPAGLPHSFLVPEGEHLTYVLVKFPAAEEPAQP